MSSRNGYLTPQEREIAPTLYKTISWLAEEIKTNKNFNELCQHAGEKINQAGLTTDYISICHAYTLAAANKDDKNMVILASAFCGKARLIDNIVVNL